MIESVDPKTLELLGLPPPDQIGVVVRDLQKAIEAYTKLFQWGPFEVIEREYNESASTYRGKPGNFRYRIGYTQLGPIQLEMIQPLRGKTIYNEFLEARGEGFHHFGILIDRIEERVDHHHRAPQDAVDDDLEWRHMGEQPPIERNDAPDGVGAGGQRQPLARVVMFVRHGKAYPPSVSLPTSSCRRNCL